MVTKRVGYAERHATPRPEPIKTIVSALGLVADPDLSQLL
jgi:hypothetical protein